MSSSTGPTGGMVDLRSDTVTTPTPAMRRAMADAEVGDDLYGEDPTVRRLESLAAGLLGKEAALYVPSGTMANQLAIRLLGRPGTEMLCGERAHVYRHEHAASAGNAQVQLRPLPDTGGVVTPSDIERRARRTAAPPPRALRADDREHAHGRERASMAGSRARCRRRCRPRRWARGALRRRADLERLDGPRDRASGARRRHRHHDVLLVEGLVGAGRLGALRYHRVDRRRACGPVAPRWWDAPGRRDRRRGRGRARDDGRPPRRRPHPRTPHRRGACRPVPRERRPRTMWRRTSCARARTRSRRRWSTRWRCTAC